MEYLFVTRWGVYSFIYSFIHSFIHLGISLCLKIKKIVKEGMLMRKCHERPVIWQKRPIIWQKRPIRHTKETYHMAKETYYTHKRDLLIYWHTWLVKKGDKLLKHALSLRMNDITHALSYAYG